MDTLSELLEGILQRGGDLAIRITAAFIIALIIVGAGLAFRPLLGRRLQRKGRPSRTRVFSALYTVVVVLFAVLLAITFAFPSVRVADVLASLGIISVAVGFAFKNVLENLLAGVLLLLRDPFRSGDEIRVAGHEGTVEGVTIRETLIRTFDGQRVLIPNAQVYTGSLEVSTHYPTARVSFRLLLDAGTDAAKARSVIGRALRGMSVEGTPKPNAVVTDAESGALEIEVRLWAPSDRSSRTAAIDRAVPAVVEGLREAGIRFDEPQTVLIEGGDQPPPGPDRSGAEPVTTRPPKSGPAS